MSSADDRYVEKVDAPGSDVPNGDVIDNSYVSRTGQSEIPVQSDNKPVGDPIDPATADSDETLARDDAEVIDEANIIESRTRGAKPTMGYKEPGDEEGLPEDEGRSST